MRRPAFDLLIITDGRADVVARVEQALTSRPERVAILLRDKLCSAAELFAQARALRSVTHTAGATLLISDRVDVAIAAHADGVHLPESGLPVEHARSLLGPDKWVGVSRHVAHSLQHAAAAGADYATLSPVFASPHKGQPLGIEAFARATQECSLPLFALGGVTAREAPELVRRGAAGVAVIREVMDASNPAAAILKLRMALAAAQPHPRLAPSGAPG